MGDPGHDVRSTGDQGLPPRPRPVPPPAERIAAWLTWFGPSRLALTAVCVVVVALAGFWLVRAPAPSAEATLPVATSGDGTVASASTLPPPTTMPSTTSPTTVVVHVAGEVRAPGVYVFEGRPRVNDAIERAGGATDVADLDAVNLAQSLDDGQRLFVPPLGATDLAALPVLTPERATSADGGASDAQTPPGPVDINRAGAAELETLPGVGPSTAQAIIDDRQRNGPFATVDELDRVPGIGPAKLAALIDLVSV